MDRLTDGLLWYVVFLFSTVCHEAAHAWSAMKLGDRTAYEGGQVTIDPLPHLRREPFGTIVVPILSFLVGGWMIGWASAPYDPLWAMRYPKRSALMSLAGPATNLLLLILAALAIRTGLYYGVFRAPESISFTALTVGDGRVAAAFAALLSVGFSLNLILFVFNLIPLPPLDGSGVVPLVLPEDTARRYLDFVRHPAFSLFGLLVAWRLFSPIFHPLHLIAINLLYPGLEYR